jgi:Ca2+/H+ antiporter, TMEM165/GDT1 family
MRARWIKRTVKVAVIVTMAATVFGFLVMSLWNWLAPEVFGLHAITFWQALGLLLLSKILFGGFHGRPGFGGHWRHRMSGRWQRMTAEEREKFRQGMLRRCGGAGLEAEELRDRGGRQGI